jgi:4-amino-4-deoxy-L-arabinose transferase-like glycosyltransferase
VGAAVIAAVYPVLIGADGSLMSESLYGVLVAASLLLAFRLRDRQDARSAALLGAAIGLAALTRSEALLLLVVLALPLALMGPAAGRLRRVAACVLAAAVVLAPWLVRNWAEFDRPVLISTNDGTLLAGANCPLTYRGPDLGLWTVRCISAPVFTNEADQAARWSSEGAGYATDHPGRVPVVVAARLLRTFDLYQPWRMVPFAEARLGKVDKAGVLAYWLLLPFGFAGAWVMWRRGRRADLLTLLTPVVLVIATSVFGYGFPRFRLAADIVLVVLAAYSLAESLNTWRGREPREPKW